METSKIKMHYHNFTNRPVDTEIHIDFKGRLRKLGLQSCIIFELKKSYKMFFIFENTGYYSMKYHTTEKWLNYQGRVYIPYDKQVYIKAIAPSEHIILSALEDLICRNEFILQDKYLSLSDAGDFTGIKVYNIAHLHSDLKHLGE